MTGPVFPVGPKIIAPPNGKVSAWIRTALTEVEGTGARRVIDVLNPSSIARQVVNARRPSLLTTSNGLPRLRFATNDALSWALNGGNDLTKKFGFATWLRQPTSALETVFAIYNGTGGASVRRLYMQFNTGNRFVFGAYIDGTNGRQGMTSTGAFNTGDWVWVYCPYDSSRGGDANVRIRINGNEQTLTYANLGAGGTLGELPAATGNALFGNLNDGTALTAFNGDVGPNLFILRDNLTVDEELSLMNFERPL